jgi:hypothetical protein
MDLAELDVVTSLPASRDAPRRETNLRFRHLESLPHKPTNLLLICRRSLAISLPGNQSVTGNLLGIIIQLIVLLTLLNAALAVSSCLILAIRVSSKFRVLRERFYEKRIYP